MSPHKINPDRKQRIPLTIYGDDCSLLLNLKHHLEKLEGEPITITKLLTNALRAYADANGVSNS